MVVLALLLAGVGTTAESVAPAVLAAERALQVLEREDDGALPVIPGEGYRFEMPPKEHATIVRDLPLTARSLDDHLRARPTDARGLVARGRLLRQQYILRAYDETGVAIPGPDVDPRVEVVALLDRALAVDSTLAAAHYAKALTLATTILFTGNVVGGQGTERFEEALGPARTAHRLAPEDARAMNLLERCLLATGRDLEAEALRVPAAAGSDGLTPVGRTLQRLALVPVPPGVRPSPRLRESHGMFVQRRSGDPSAASRYAHMAAYQTESVSIDSLQAFYRRAWPGLTWVDERMDPAKSMGLDLTTRSAVAVLQWSPPGAWVPSTAIDDPFERTDVLFIWIREIDFEAFRSGLPDSLKDRPLPATTSLVLLDRVEDDR